MSHYTYTPSPDAPCECLQCRVYSLERERDRLRWELEEHRYQLEDAQKEASDLRALVARIRALLS